MSSSQDNSSSNNAAEHVKTAHDHPSDFNVNTDADEKALASERGKPQRSRSVQFDRNVVVIKDKTTVFVYPKEGPRGEASKGNYGGGDEKDNKKR